MNKKLLVAAAVSGLMAAGMSMTASAESAPAPKKGECHGVNSCKGKGACGGEGYSCAGKNECKGKGWLKMTESDCKAMIKKMGSKEGMSFKKG